LKENKTKKLIGSAIIASLSLSAAGCSGEIPPQPEDNSCQDWEWDDELGVWECDDYDSPRYGHYFYGGKYFSGKSALKSSKVYQSYKNSSSFKGGFGSGSRGGFGG
jgi:hypothetical protein